MRNLVTKSSWTTGAGVSEKDLYPSKVELVDNQYLFESTAYIGGDALQSGDTQFTYIQETDVRVNPGFFYIKDREFYAYNEKITQFSRQQHNNNLSYVTLLELPNGTGTINYGEFLAGNYSNRTEDIFGTPPIIVRYFPSGTLESIGVVFDEAISSRNGIDKQMGYRMDLSGDIVSGDTDTFPDYFSPMSRFTKCPEYWVESNVLKYDEYSYDYLNNRIIMESGEPGTEYMIEYENLNIPFRSGIELNPLKTAPGDYVLVITPDDTEQNTVPGNVLIDLSNDITAGDQVNIRVRITDTNNLEISGEPVELSIFADDLTLSGDSYVGVIDGNMRTPYYFNLSGAMYDYIPAAPGDTISMAGISQLLTAQIVEDGTKFYIPSYGNLFPYDYSPVEWRAYNLSGCPYSPYLSGATDDFGYFRAIYVPPAKILGDMNIKLRVKVAGLSDGIKEIRLSSNRGNKLLQMYKPSFTEYLGYNTVAYDYGTTSVILKSPEDILFPTDMSIYDATEYMLVIKGGAAPSKSNLVGMHISGDNMYIRLNELGSGGYDPARTNAIYRYKKRDEVNISDGRSVYVI